MKLLRHVAAVLVLLCILVPLVVVSHVAAESGEGGFLELSNDTAVRPIYSASMIGSFMPSTRTSGTFPAPYGTKFWRVTIPADCGNLPCVNHIGYSYWRRLSNDGDNLYIMVGLSKDIYSSAGGPTLFRLVKSTGALTKVGAIFNDADQSQSGEDMYFSAAQPTKLYYKGDSAFGTTLKMIDVLTHQSTTVLDISTQPALYGTGRYIWQAHSSADDNVHVFSVASVTRPGEWLGCGAYIVSSNLYKYFPRTSPYNDMDECDVDQSGGYLHMKDQTDGLNGQDSRFINLRDNSQIVLKDEYGGAGHSDTGHGFVVQADNWTSPPTARLWSFGTNPPRPGTIVYQSGEGTACLNGRTCGSFNHVSLLNGLKLSPESQWAVASGATVAGENDARTNEIIAFKLDGSLKTLVIAPVMTKLPSTNFYPQLPFANVDSAGRYAIWTTNLGIADGPLTAILVRIPSAAGFLSAPSAPANLRITQ